MHLHVRQANRFFKTTGPRGYQRTFFFARLPLVESFELSDAVKITGFVSYRYLLVNSAPTGVAFESIKVKTTVKDYMLLVGIDREEIPNSFEPIFSLEKMGILIYRAANSAILAIPSNVESSLLVKVSK